MVELRDDLELHLDRVSFAERLGIIPDPWQGDLLRSSSDRVLMNCARQSGKSLMSAIMALHRALYHPGSLVLILAPAERQARETFAKAARYYRALGSSPGAASADSDRKMGLELRSGSRIEALPGTEKTIRGFSGVDLLIVDEAARVSDELYYSVRPMLAVSAGQLVALSTPFGTRGWWYEAWRGSEAWERYEVPVTEVPRINPEFLEEERRTLGPWWYEQEYECKFLDAQTQAFRREDIDRTFSEEVEAWQL
jgi:hypothetical protein